LAGDENSDYDKISKPTLFETPKANLLIKSKFRVLSTALDLITCSAFTAKE
jgi:hypothetical protein